MPDPFLFTAQRILLTMQSGEFYSSTNTKSPQTLAFLPWKPSTWYMSRVKGSRAATVQWTSSNIPAASVIKSTWLFLSSIAMATKENMTFQRGMLKSIQTRVTTLASILFFLFYICSLSFRMMSSVDYLCRPEHSVSPITPLHFHWEADIYTITIHLFCFPSWCIFLAAVSLTHCEERETPFLIIFLHRIPPPLQIASPPSTTSSRKSICARGGTLWFWVGWLASASSSSCSTLCTDVLLSLIVTSRTKSNHFHYTGVSKIYAFILFTCPIWE